MNDELVKLITDQVLKVLQQEKDGQLLSAEDRVPFQREYRINEIPMGVSARHIHLSQEDLEVLFGKGYRLTRVRELPQPGEFVAQETVRIKGPRNSIDNVRILGDLRSFSQVEVSRTDAYTLGITPMVRKSGDIAGTPGISVIGPAGTLELQEGVIVANRHIHMNHADAKIFQVNDSDEVDVRIVSEKPAIWGKVQVRVGKELNLYMHIDLDDANSVGFNPKTDYAEILKQEVQACCWQA